MEERIEVSSTFGYKAKELVEEELLDEQGIHLLTPDEIAEEEAAQAQSLLTETEARTILEFQEYSDKGKRICRHEGCTTKINFYSWRKGYQVCSRCFEIREGVGFCIPRGHDLYKVGKTEKGQCVACAEIDGEWGSVERKEKRKGEPRKRGAEKFYALPGLRAAREAKGMAISELGRQVGVSATSIRRYENGEQHAPKLTIEALARVLKVKVKQLKDGG